MVLTVARFALDAGTKGQMDSVTKSKWQRWKPNDEQRALLRFHFENIDQFPKKDALEELAGKLGTTERRIRVWFQNQRQRKEEDALIRANEAKRTKKRSSVEAPDVFGEPSASWFDLPPPQWAVYAACMLRAFPMLRIERIVEGIRSILSFEGHEEVFAAARRAVLAKAEDASHEERLLVGEARYITSYCFCNDFVAVACARMLDPSAERVSH